MAGVTVGVTGTAHFADRMSSVLREKGAEPWNMSFMEIEPNEESLPEFLGYGWLVFTSPNGVRVFLERMRRERRDLRTLSGHKIAVIGPGTAEAFEEVGINVDYMPPVYDSLHLAEGLAHIILDGQDRTKGPDGEGRCQKAGGQGRQCPVLLLRAKQGSDVLPQTFREHGIPCEEHPLYEPVSYTHLTLPTNSA